MVKVKISKDKVISITDNFIHDFNLQENSSMKELVNNIIKIGTETISPNGKKELTFDADELHKIVLDSEVVNGGTEIYSEEFLALPNGIINSGILIS